MRILFGAAYYPEYYPAAIGNRVDLDLEMMAAAGFTVIRVGESVWSDWEPREGKYNLGRIADVLDAAQRKSIGVIVGTPTYAVPPWMRRNYPATAAQRRSGEPIKYGHRQDADFTHPDFRRLAGKLITQIVDRYASHPAVIGWQLDNEPGIELLHNPQVFTGFRDYLKDLFGTVDALNSAWGLSYWSHRISEWDELWAPDGNTVPAYDLAWRRYQAGLTTEFISWQYNLVKPRARDDQFVTTCLALNRSALDASALASLLDVTATNIYFPAQAALTLPHAPASSVIARPNWMPTGGVADLHLQLDTARGVRDEPFLVTETQAKSIGESHVNYPPYPGQLRLVALTMTARGARAIEYWHWHTLHSGHEAYWGGVLGHDLEPDRIYHEVARIGAELADLTAEFGSLTALSDVALMIDLPSRWAMNFNPPFAIPGTNLPDARSADRATDAFQTGLFAEGIAVDVIATEVELDVKRWPVVVAPALYAVSDEAIDRLTAYANAGGHLVLGPRFGYADESAVPRTAAMPARITKLLGARYREYTNLSTPESIEWTEGESVGDVTDWVDCIVTDPDGPAETVARYTSQAHAEFAAIVSSRVGDGRISYIGTVPDSKTSRILARWIRETSLGPDRWERRPESVSVNRMRSEDGRIVVAVANWSPDTVTVEIPDSQTLLDLGPWDIRFEVVP